MKHTRETISGKKITWLNIVNATPADTAYLRSKFKFLESDLDDALAHTRAQRPKVLIRPQYIFAVFLFPYYNTRTRKVGHTEVDLFITADHVITMHYDITHTLRKFFDELKSNISKRNIYLSDTPALFLYELLRAVYATKYPILDMISRKIDAIEGSLFERRERELTSEILQVRRNIVTFKKAMLTHNVLLEQLRDCRNSFWKQSSDVVEYYNRLRNHAEIMWTTCTNYYETINALEDTNNTLVTFRLNDIMRTLTIFSVIVFPLTLFAAIFGMNTAYIPLVGLPNDFWIITGIMAVGTIGMYLYFKKKRWI